MVELEAQASAGGPARRSADRVSHEACRLSFGQRIDAWAARMTAMKKYVFSSTLEKADWNNTTIVRGNAAAEVGRLKQEDGGDLLIYGHTSLAAALFKERLINVFHIAYIRSSWRGAAGSSRRARAPSCGSWPRRPTRKGA
jgi:UDP-2,3-diacylglucosamine pyrophosphatase LpxH